MLTFRTDGKITNNQVNTKLRIQKRHVHTNWGFKTLRFGQQENIENRLLEKVCMRTNGPVFLHIFFIFYVYILSWFILLIETSVSREYGTRIMRDQSRTAWSRFCRTPSPFSLQSEHPRKSNLSVKSSRWMSSTGTKIM